MGSVVPPARPAATAPFTQRLSQSVPLSSTEIPLLLELQSDSRSVCRGREIITEGRPCRTFFIVRSGVLIRYRVLRDGGRQVISVVLPGDIAGVPGCFFENALYSVRTLTDTVVSPVPFSRMMSLFHTHPQLAAKICWSFSYETAIYAEHLIAIARRSAFERVAHFLLELLIRLQAINLADERSFCLPLTQELIADALGLSIPYVNRVLRSLRDDDLVRIKDKVVVIKDVEALSMLVDFEGSYLKPFSIVELLNEGSEPLPRQIS